MRRPFRPTGDRRAASRVAAEAAGTLPGRSPCRIRFAARPPRAEAHSAASRPSSNGGTIVIWGTSTSPMSVMRISGITESGMRLKPM